MQATQPSETNPLPEWIPPPIETLWDDLLEGIETPVDWAAKRPAVARRFAELIRAEAAPPQPETVPVEIEREWDADGYRIRDVNYPVEADERAHAYVAIPDAPPPPQGYPGVVCLHGTTNWGARQTLGLPPLPGDPHADRSIGNKDFARQLVRHGYVTVSPEHFCSARRMPAEGPYETAAFYRRHPDWSAVGKYVHDSRIACTVLAAMPEVDAGRLGVTGHSLGGQGSIWLAAADDRIRCAAPSCAASTFRANAQCLQWSRDRWYVYFPQLRREFLAGRRVACDFHEMMALIAPRPLLDRFALNDGEKLNQAHRTMLHLTLRRLYRLLNAESAHAFLVFGDGHAIPELSSSAMLSWMDRWLKD